MTQLHRLYGTIFGLSREEVAPLLSLLSPCEVENEDPAHFEFSFEGVFPEPIDDFLETIQLHLPEHARGHLDYIDNDAWTLFRYTFTQQTKTTETIHLDDYLDRYRHFG